MRKGPLVETRAAMRENSDLISRWKVDAVVTGFPKIVGETNQAYSERIGHYLIGLLAPSVDKADEIRLRANLENQMAMLLLAAAQVHAKTGKWPGTLNELAPTYVKQIPRDLYPVDNT